MRVIEKIKLKLKIEIKFLLEQRWGLKSPSDPHTISKSVIKKYLPKEPIIVDCGAHNGADSIELAKIFPNAKIYCFEPVPAIFNNLRKATKKYLNIECFQIALSDCDGEAKFFISSGDSDASSSLMFPTGHKSTHPGVIFDEGITVNCLTLDSWAKKTNLNRIDFLWLDMQGYELKMLKASSEILNTVKLIFTEVSLISTYEGVALYPEYRLWLESIGFKVALEAIPTGTDMGNVLFKRK